MRPPPRRVSTAAQLVPRPLVIRLFLAYADGAWRAMPGGLGCALPDGAAVWPVGAPGLAKDVWVLAQDPLDIAGAPARPAPALAIRRTAGDLPSRAADNFFWLGRYLERLEGAARLLRARPRSGWPARPRRRTKRPNWRC